MQALADSPAVYRTQRVACRPGRACRGVALVEPALAGHSGTGPGSAGAGHGPARPGMDRGRQRGDDRGRGPAGSGVRAPRPAVRVGGLDDRDRPEPGTGVQPSTARSSASRRLGYAERERSPLRFARNRGCRMVCRPLRTRSSQSLQSSQITQSASRTRDVPVSARPNPRRELGMSCAASRYE